MEGLVVGGGCGVWGAQQGRAQRLGTEAVGEGGGDGSHWCCLHETGVLVFLVLVSWFWSLVFGGWWQLGMHDDGRVAYRITL